MCAAPLITSLPRILCGNIITLNEQGKHPLVVLLIGSAPSFSKTHQQPEFLTELVEDPSLIDVNPLVVLIDHSYKHNGLPGFMNGKIGEFTIPSLPELHNRCQFMLIPEMISDEDVVGVIDQVTKLASIIVFSFTGSILGHDHHSESEFVYIPPGNCFADTKFNSNYHPKMQIINSRIHIDDAPDDLAYFVNSAETASACLRAGVSLEDVWTSLEQSHGFVYYFIKFFLDDQQPIRSWTYQTTTSSNPEWRRDLSKVSADKYKASQERIVSQPPADDGFGYLQYRLGPYHNIESRVVAFQQSEHKQFLEFLDGQTMHIGMQLVDFMMHYLEIYDAKHPGKNNQTLLTTIDNFLEEMFAFQSNEQTKFPSLFEVFLDDALIKNPKLNKEM